MIDVEQLIEDSLGHARSVIEQGGVWDPLVQVVHALGVDSMRVPELHAGSLEKAQAVAAIESWSSALRGMLLITVSDVWIGGDTPDGSVAISWDIPFSDRRKALFVETRGCCDQYICGIQKYGRCADGQVHFDKFCFGLKKSAFNPLL